MTNKLTPKEVTIIQMALQTTIEDNESVMKDQTLPFTPEARTLARDLIKTAKSALIKMQEASGHVVKLDPYQEGDEQEFLTKKS